jgi:hypothetical protein
VIMEGSAEPQGGGLGEACGRDGGAPQNAVLSASG